MKSYVVASLMAIWFTATMFFIRSANSDMHPKQPNSSKGAQVRQSFQLYVSLLLRFLFHEVRDDQWVLSKNQEELIVEFLKTQVTVTLESMYCIKK